MASKKKAALVPTVAEISGTVDRPSHPRIDFIKSIKLIGLGLERCDCHVSRDSLSEIDQEQLLREIKVDQQVLSHEDSYFIIGAEFDYHQAAKDSEEVVVSIKATYSARFDTNVKASSDHVTQFAIVEARLVFFPYFRQLVADMTARMSIRPELLPLTSELEQH